MKRRIALIATLLAAVLVVSAPAAAFAYWVISAQTSIAAQSATFSVSAPGSPSGVTNQLTASANDLSGFSGTTTSSAIYTNTGATPWAAVTVSVGTTASFGSGALATSTVAIVASTAACPTTGTYTALTAGAATLPVAVASGAAVKVCVRTAYDRLSVQNRTASSALQIVVTPAQQNWTAASTAMTVTTTAPAAGMMRCTDNGDTNAVLTFIVPQDGTYRWVDVSTGASASLLAGTTQLKTFGWAFFGTTGSITVSVQRQTGSTWTTVAQGAIVGTSTFLTTYRCA